MTHVNADNDSVVGIDVAKDKLDVLVSDSGELLTVGNDEAGIRQLVALCKKVSPAIIVAEATGGYEKPLIDAMLDAGLPIARVQPGRVRQYARALGILAKTDKIDAAVLVQYARHARPRLAEKQSENREKLKAWVGARRQLLQASTALKNQIEAAHDKDAQRSLKRALRSIEKEVEVMDKKIRDLIEADKELADDDRLLQSVKGVGPVLSATLLSDMDELGAVSRTQIAALTGVAPYNNESGKHQAKRTIRGGRTEVRNVLYMATQAAIKFNPVIRAFSERLKAKGKTNKVRITACMRKLIVLLNAMLRERLTWSQLKIAQPRKTS